MRSANSSPSCQVRGGGPTNISSARDDKAFVRVSAEEEEGDDEAYTVSSEGVSGAGAGGSGDPTDRRGTECECDDWDDDSRCCLLLISFAFIFIFFRFVLLCFALLTQKHRIAPIVNSSREL